MKKNIEVAGLWNVECGDFDDAPFGAGSSLNCGCKNLFNLSISKHLLIDSCNCFRISSFFDRCINNINKNKKHKHVWQEMSKTSPGIMNLPLHSKHVATGRIYGGASHAMNPTRMETRDTKLVAHRFDTSTMFIFINHDIMVYIDLYGFIWIYIDLHGFIRIYIYFAAYISYTLVFISFGNCVGLLA